MTIPVETLLQYRETSWKWVKKFYQLRPNDEDVGQLLQDLDSNMARVELYLLEEAMANYVKFVDLGKDVLPDLDLLEMPENVSHTYDAEADTHTFTFPLWPFAPKRLRRLRPPFHKGREFVRISDFWSAIFDELVEPEHSVRDRQGVKPGKDKATVHFNFKILREIDIDNYDVGPVVNALVGSGAILNDHPSRMKLRMDYETVADRKDELGTVTVKYAF